MRIQHLLISCVLAVATLSAHAFERPFPANAKRGVMTVKIYPAIVIDGKPRTLSPGGRIWNKNNTIDMPGALRGREFVVNYTENHQDDIDRVWILSDAEAKRPPPKPLPKPLPASEPVPLPTPQ